MPNRILRQILSCLSLVLWLAMIVAPWVTVQAKGGHCLLEFDHQEGETEGEEWKIEWEQCLLSEALESDFDCVNWHVAHLHNVELHERLDASRLLDPPDVKQV